MKFKSSAWLVIALSAFLFAGCSSTGSKEDDPGAVGRWTAARPVPHMGASHGGAWTGNPLDNPNSLLYTKTIYFDFDQSTIRSEFIDVLRAHAAYLNKNRNERC